MSRTTILIACPYYPPHGGGLERYVEEVAAKLIAHHNYRIIIATTSDLHGADTIEHHDHLTIYRFGYRIKLSNTPFDISWRAKIKHLIATEKPDLINVHGPVPGLIDITASLAGKIPLVVSWHAASMRKASGWANLLVDAYEKLLLPRMLRRAVRITSASNFVKHGFLQRWKTKIQVVNPGINLEAFQPRASVQNGQMVFVAGTIGPSYLHKGLEVIARAMPKIIAQVPQAQLRVVGDAIDKAYITPLLNQLGVASNVQFVGWKDGQALASEYQQSQLLIHPALQDNYPMTILEAMACARPVVASRVGDVASMVEDGVTGYLVKPGDSQAMADNVIALLTNPTLADAMGAAGRKQLEHGASWSHRAVQMHGVYEAALTHPGGTIAEVSAYYPPHIGGMENVVAELATHLYASGHPVEVFTSDRTSSRAASIEAQTSPRIHRLPSLEFLKTPIMPGLFWELMQLPKHSIIHVHISQALVPEISWLVARLRNFTLVSHIHLDVEASSLIGKFIFGPYKRIFLGFVLRRSHQVIVFTDVQQDLMVAKYQLKPERVAILPNGVAGIYFKPAHRTVKEPMRLLYVGRIAVQKRLDRLIEAMASLPNAQLDVVGDGPLRAKMEQLSNDLKLRNVTFHGFMQGEALLDMYDTHDALVLPSDREGMPLVALEAMASGLPVIGSDVTGIRELIAGAGILVPQPSAESFARTLADVIKRPATLHQAAAACRSRAQDYSWDIIMKRLAKILYEARS